MFKALLKKQLKEFFATAFVGRAKNGKKRNVGGKIGAGFLLLIVFASLAMIFFVVADSLAPLCTVGLAWFYFLILGAVSAFVAVIGSAFSTYTGLFMAKDNDLLLSMPIPPSKILLVRIIGVWIIGLIYQLVAIIPTIVAAVKHGAIGVNYPLIIIMVLMVSFFVTAVSCLLGWIISLVAIRLKNKSFVTVIIALVFMGAYYYCYMKFLGNLSQLISGASTAAEGFSTSSIVYVIGSGLCSNVVNAAIVSAVCIAAFVVMYVIMSKTFIKVVTTNHGEKKKDYVRSTKIKSSSVKQAIFRKELKAFTSSANYMLNTSLGTLFALICVVLLIIKRGDIGNLISILSAEFGNETSSLLAVVVVCIAMFLAGSNDIITPSISLESKTRWLYSSLPITILDVIRQKMKLHLLLTMVPTLLVVLTAIILLPFDIATSVAVFVVSALVVLMLTEFDLFLGMVKPNYSWTNEVQAIKQSWTVLVAMFGGWIMAVLIFFGYIGIGSNMNTMIYLGIVAVFAIVVILVIESYVKKRSMTVFME